MTITAPAVEDRIRDAWQQYADDLRDLAGEDYELAEHDAWEHLQATLALIETEREADLHSGVPTD